MYFQKSQATVIIVQNGGLCHKYNVLKGEHVVRRFIWCERITNKVLNM